jgi:hypothetical protein
MTRHSDRHTKKEIKLPFFKLQEYKETILIESISRIFYFYIISCSSKQQEVVVSIEGLNFLLIKYIFVVV